VREKRIRAKKEELLMRKEKRVDLSETKRRAGMKVFEKRKTFSGQASQMRVMK